MGYTLRPRSTECFEEVKLNCSFNHHQAVLSCGCIVYERVQIKYLRVYGAKSHFSISKHSLKLE